MILFIISSSLQNEEKKPKVTFQKHLPNQFRNIIEYHIKSKYPEEFSTCDKVGSEKP